MAQHNIYAYLRALQALPIMSCHLELHISPRKAEKITRHRKIEQNTKKSNKYKQRNTNDTEHIIPIHSPVLISTKRALGSVVPVVPVVPWEVGREGEDGERGR